MTLIEIGIAFAIMVGGPIAVIVISIGIAGFFIEIANYLSAKAELIRHQIKERGS